MARGDSHADAPLARLYRAGIWLVYTRAAQIGFGALAILGLAAFLATSRQITGTVHATHAGGRLLLFLIPAYLLSILIHEAGHAFTVKACGRKVPRVGIGWYWFGPVAYVDTSDMWLAEKWPRVAVSLAGPYSNIILAGAAALVGCSWAARRLPPRRGSSP